MDLAEWYAAGRWVALLDLIDGLPAACRLNEAIMNDPEMAEQLAKEQKPSQEWAPGVAEFDLNAHMLREILHTLKNIRQINIAAAGASPGEEKPFPAPRTEYDRAKEAADRKWAADFVGLFGFSPEDI